MRGGKRPGAGRRKGSRGKKTAALLEAVEKSGVTPLAYMLAKMRDEKEKPEVRDEMAKAAAPYCHSKLAAIEHAREEGDPVQHTMTIRFVAPKHSGSDKYGSVHF